MEPENSLSFSQQPLLDTELEESNPVSLRI
jgi:hypothetical protein